MVQDDIGPEPERYWDWMGWKLRQSEKLQEARKYSKQKRKEEVKKKHIHSNALMLDLKEMTREEIWKKTVADLQTEIHELQMMVVRLQEKLNKMQEDNYDEEEANRRMDIIGQNGNDGLHYSEVEDSNLHGPEFRQRFRT